MRIRWTNLALALGVITLSVSAFAAPPKHRHRTHRSAHKATHKVSRARSATSGAESSLVGVTLFDNGVHVINLYGTPDTVQAANVSDITQTGGGGGGAPGAGGGRFPGRGGAGMPPGMGPGSGAAPGGPPGYPGAQGGDFSGPDQFGDEVLRQVGRRPGMAPGMGGPPGAYGPPGAGGPPGAYGPPGGMTGGPPGGRGAFPGGPGVPGGRGMGPNSGGAAADNVVYTRWSYVRGASRYGFVFDKFNRVVQIEAIGIDNPKVRTRRGITFGASFASLIKTYGAPDGYDIGGDTSLTVRYLIKSKVAFRLSRLSAKKPPVVTGIVIAAAKG